MSRRWPRKLLGEVLTERQESPSLHDLISGIVKVVEKISFTTGQLQFRTTGHTKTKMILVRPGDLVVSGINAAKGAIAVYDEGAAEPVAATIHYAAYIPNRDYVRAEYLWWLLRSPVFRDLLFEYLPGGIKTELKATRLLSIPVPIPGLAEQDRIIGRIRELAAIINDALSLRQHASTQAGVLRETTLGSYFHKLAQRYPLHPLGMLTSHIVDGPHKTPAYLPNGASGVPFVTVKNMVTGRLDFSDLNYISAEDHRTFTKRCRPEYGDVLYSKDGATRGRPCFVDTEREFSYFVSVALLKPLRALLDGRYLVHLLNSSWIKNQMIDKSRGDMIPHIVLREIRGFSIPLPPLSEQQAIVAPLDRVEAEIFDLRALQNQTRLQLEALMPAVVGHCVGGH